MSYDDKSDRMDWKDEARWLVISLVSGVLLACMFVYLNRFPRANQVVIYVACCIGFYLLSILVRIQNHRGKPLTGKTGVQEHYLKYIFPILGFGMGLAVLLFH